MSKLSDTDSDRSKALLHDYWKRLLLIETKLFLGAVIYNEGAWVFQGWGNF